MSNLINRAPNTGVTYHDTEENSLLLAGGGNYPPKIQECIESWRRVLPDYEIIVWDENQFDVRSVPWVRRAFRLEKYAFAADYIRHYALYTEGGIYLDTDIEIRKPFDELLTA